ncbi:MAG TPA: recombinase family protein, partial [Methylomirabilota bacterium]|nr:recombinase family protein [Methylomirabilota bacterium]
SVPVLDAAGRVDAGGQPLRVGTELVIEPDEARIVRQIFELFAGGVSMRAVAHRLNAQAVAFPAASIRRGAKRKGWAQSAVRVILLNEKYRGQWIFGRRAFVKDPVSGRRRARLRPPREWQIAEQPDLRLIPEALWQAVQARFQQLASVYGPRRNRGRLEGRDPASPSARTGVFSGLLRCGTCGGSLVVINGHPRREHRRYGCGFHRDKGSRICSNGLSVRVGTVETRLVATLREHVLQPAAVEYLVAKVNEDLDAIRAARGEAQRALETELAQVETELRNIEAAIAQGVVGKTTAALLNDREGRRDALQARLRAVTDGRSRGPCQVGPAEIRASLEELDALLKRDSARANSVIRQVLEPITMMPVEENGRRFYRAMGAAKGVEMLDRLGLAQAVDFGGCGGWI